jgi:hypothetical protein
MPWSRSAFVVAAEFGGASKAGVALTAGTASGAVAAGRERRTSACTARVESVTTPAISKAELTPTTSHIRSDDFELVLPDFRRSTICPFY